VAARVVGTQEALHPRKKAPRIPDRQWWNPGPDVYWPRLSTSPSMAGGWSRARLLPVKGWPRASLLAAW